MSKIQGPIKGQTSGGGITLGECKGAIKVETSGGGIGIHAGEGTRPRKRPADRLRSSNSKGMPSSRPAAGGIMSEQIEGNLRHPLRAVRFSQPSWPAFPRLPPRNVRREYHSRLNDNTALDVDASTNGGRVDSDLPVTVVGRNETQLSPRKIERRRKIAGAAYQWRQHQSAQALIEYFPRGEAAAKGAQESILRRPP